MIDTALSIFITLATIPAVLSVIAYARAPWWRTRIGRHLMTYMGSLALLLVLVWIGDLFIDEDPLWWELARLGASMAFAGALWWRFIIIVAEQRREWKGAKERHKGNE